LIGGGTKIKAERVKVAGGGREKEGEVEVKE